MEDSDKKRLESSVHWLEREYSGIRTGQASPALLDGVKVEVYGSFLPIPQVGSVGIEDARTLRISPWDASTVPTIERAIQDADLGVSVVTDSSGLRVIFPELTSERREQLRKLAKTKLEDARVAVRATRDECMKAVEKAEKDGDISEDEMHRQKEAIQKAVDATNTQLEQLYKQKDTEVSA